MLARLALLLVASALVAPSVSAQVEIRARAATITLGGRLHTQYGHSSMDAAENDFLIRRARLEVDLRMNDFLSGRLQPDFGGGAAALKDVYVAMSFSDAFVVSFGQFKRSFDVFELASSTDLSLIERDGRVEGLSVCTGVGSICSYSRFTEALDYADRDMGVRIAGSSGALSYQASLTNGPGADTPDDNDKKSGAGRLTLEVAEDVRLSGQVALRDYVDANGDQTAVAFGGDLEIGTWRDGLLVQAALVRGDNWMAPDPSLEPATFMTWQAVGSYYHPLDGDGRIEAVEPLVRLSWGDPDTDADDDSGFLVTPGLMLYVMGRSKIGVNLDYYSPQSGSSEWSLKVQSFLYY